MQTQASVVTRMSSTLKYAWTCIWLMCMDWYIFYNFVTQYIHNYDKSVPSLTAVDRRYQDGAITTATIKQFIYKSDIVGI